MKPLTKNEQWAMAMFADAPGHTLGASALEKFRAQVFDGLIEKGLLLRDYDDKGSLLFRVPRKKLGAMYAAKAKLTQTDRAASGQVDVILVSVDGDPRYGWVKAPGLLGAECVAQTERVQACGKRYRTLTFPIKEAGQVAAELRYIGAVVENRLARNFAARGKSKTMPLPQD